MQVVDWLWQYAFDQRASDIHLEPRRELSLIRFRIDGVMHTVYQLPPGVMNAMVARVKLLGRMDVVEKRRPLDGRIKTRNPNGDEVEMRSSISPPSGATVLMRPSCGRRFSTISMRASSLMREVTAFSTSVGML